MYASETIWKSWLAPAGVTLAVIWGIYLGATSAFVYYDEKSENGEVRSSSRNISPVDRQFIYPSGDSNSEKNAIDQKSSEISPKNSGRKVSDSVQRYRSAKTTLAQTSAEKETAYRKKLAKQYAPVRQGNDKHLRAAILNEAHKTALHSQEPWRNLIIISAEYYKQRERATAREILLAAAKLAIDPDDITESSAAVRSVVKAMLAQKNYDDATSALQNIPDLNEREKAMAEIAAWSARGGYMEVAQNIVSLISDVKNRDVALVAIAESQASYEGVEVAFRTAESVSQLNKKDDTYRRIALKRARLNSFTDAQVAIVRINNTKLKDSALTTVARYHAHSGDMQGGLQTLQGVSDPAVADESLRFFSDDLAKAGWFASSAYVTKRIGGEKEKSYALQKLSQELAKSGDVSLSLLHTDAIPLSSVRERTLRYVSTVTAAQGAPAIARNVALRISSDGVRDEAYRDISQASARNGNHVDAYNTLQNIDFPRDKALALVSLARVLQKDGRGRKANAMLEGVGNATQDLSSRNLDLVNGSLAVAYAESSQSERSLKIADKMNDTRLRDRAYQNLAKTMAQKHDITSSQRSLLSISSDQLRRSAEDSVAKTLARNIPPQKAISSSRSLLTGRQRVVFLLEVAKRS